MSVVKGKRSQSKEEFDNCFYRVYDDAVNLVLHNFYGNKTLIPIYQTYITSQGKEVMRLVNLLLYYIKKANSIFPTCESEFDTRRVAMDEAIGCCYALLTHYHLTLRTLLVKEDKHCDEYNHILHEINMIKAWRTSDNRLKKSLG